VRQRRDGKTFKTHLLSQILCETPGRRERLWDQPKFSLQAFDALPPSLDAG
jgi:hypothetical protein